MTDRAEPETAVPRTSVATSPTETDVRRLGLAKYLLHLAGQQARAPEPLAAVALLTAHDAVELLLMVTADHFDEKYPQNFHDYWDRLGPKVPPNGLPSKAAMGRLNKARVSLKHHGMTAATVEVRDLVARTRDFFDELMPLVFGVSLDSVSLFDFLTVPAVRDHLREAESHASRGELELGFKQTAGAFFELLQYCRAQGTDGFGKPLIFVSTDCRNQTPRGLSNLIGDAGKMIAAAFGKMAEAVDRTSEAVMLMSLGIDLRQHAHFRRITPGVTRYASGRTEFYWGGRRLSKSPDDLQFCISFVLESALRAQSFTAERLGNHVNS